MRADQERGTGLNLQKYENIWEGIANECDAMSEDDYHALVGLLLATGDLTDKDIDLIEGLCLIKTTRYENIRLIHELVEDPAGASYREQRINDIERKYRESRRQMCCTHLGIRSDDNARKRRTNP